MRIFMTKWFARFARREGLSDKSLVESIQRAQQGLIDADLGGGLIKQRVARPGKGRSSGYRTIIAFRAGDLAVFLSAFAKSDRENIDPDELQSIRAVAEIWLRANKAAIRDAVDCGRLQEIDSGKEDEQRSRVDS